MSTSATKSTGLRIITIGGAIAAVIIGSGYATGQEILQYFSGFGLWGVIGTSIVVFAVLAFTSIEFLRAGYEKDLARPTDVFKVFTGKYLGTFFDWFTILFCFSVFVAMVSGAGAVAESYYGVSRSIGALVVAAAVVITIWFGLDRLVAVIGKIGPVIVIIAIGLGLAAVIMHHDGIMAGNAIVAELDMRRGSSNWFLSGLAYAGFNLLLLAPILAGMGRTVRGKAELVGGGITGAGFFTLGCVVVALGLLAVIQDVYRDEVPLLSVAHDLAPWLAIVVSAIVLLGIYTTAVPLLWTVTARVAEENTRKYKIIAIALAIVGTIIGLFVPFSVIVNVVYQINGYVAILLLVCMIGYALNRGLKNRRKAEETVVEV